MSREFLRKAVQEAAENLIAEGGEHYGRIGQVWRVCAGRGYAEGSGGITLGQDRRRCGRNGGQGTCALAKDVAFRTGLKLGASVNESMQSQV